MEILNHTILLIIEHISSPPQSGWGSEEYGMKTQTFWETTNLLVPDLQFTLFKEEIYGRDINMLHYLFSKYGEYNGMCGNIGITKFRPNFGKYLQKIHPSLTKRSIKNTRSGRCWYHQAWTQCYYSSKCAWNINFNGWIFWRKPRIASIISLDRPHI